MALSHDDDLLTPTLTEADDAINFDRPWNPWSLVVLSFFFGLAAGGGLLAVNSRRLGMQGRFYPTVIAVAISVLLLAAGTGWLAGQNFGWAGILRRGMCALVALVIALDQQKRFRLYRACGLQPGDLWVPALIAIVPGFLLESLLVRVLVDYFR